MAGAREIIVRILGDATGAQKALGSLNDTADKTESRFGKMAKGIAIAGGLAAVGIAKGAIDAAAEAQKVAAQTDAVIKSTGGAANVSSKQIGDLSHRLQKLSGVQDENIQRGANMLLTFTNIKNGVGDGNKIFDEATKTALDMSVALGTDASQSAMQLGKALNDPIKGVGALSRVGVTFTDQQKEQIKALVASGDVMGAQKIILAELAKEFGGSAKAAGDAQTPIEKLKLTFGDMQEQLGAILLPILSTLTSAISSMVGVFTGLPGPVQAGIAVLAGLATGLAAVAAVTNFVKTSTVLKTAAEIAASVATKAMAAAQWVLNAALTANPIGLVVVGIGLLIAAFVLAWKHSETFREIVIGVFGVLRGVVAGFVDTFLGALEWIVKAAAKAFGWVPGIGGKLKEASKAIEGFRDDANAALSGIKDKTITVKLDATEAGRAWAGTTSRGSQGSRAHGGPVWPGRWLVGEQGPEIVEMNGSGRVHDAPTTRGMLAGGGNTYVTVNVSAPNYVGDKADLMRAVEQEVATRRRNGDPFWN